MKNNTVSVSFMMLGILFCVCLVASNLLETKVVLLGNIPITAGFLVFPISYIINDCIAEVWGYKKARLIIWMGFLMNFLVVFLSQVAVWLPAAPFWEGEEAFNFVFGLAPRIAIASLIAFLVGSFLNAYVMSRMKLASNGKHFSVRAGQGTVEYFLDEGLAALVGLGDVGGAVGVALDELFVTGFAATRHQHHLFAGGSLDVQTVAVLVGALTAAALKVIFQAKAVTVQNVQPGGRSRHTRNEVYSAGMLFQNGAIRHRNKHVLAATFAALSHIEPVVEAVPEETHLVL